MLVGTVLFSIIFACLICEILLRVLDIKPPIFKVKIGHVKVSENPILGYELNPDSPDINSFGLRGNEISIQKASDTFRILALGDSVTFGWALEKLAVPYIDHLSFLLAPPAEKNAIETVNGGVIGYNTVQEVELLTSKLYALEPDLILIGVVLNDNEPKGFEYNDIYTKDSQGTIDKAFYTQYEKFRSTFGKSLLFQNLLYRIALLKKNTATTQKNALTEKEWFTSPIIETGLTNLKHHPSTQQGKNVLVIIFPYLDENILNYSDFHTKQHQYINDIAKRHNLATLDLLRCYQDDFAKNHQTFQTSQTNDTTHPGDYGHLVAAKCIAKELHDRFGLRYNPMGELSDF